ncbi:hypothetical protein [Saccharothrix sp. Mg75]|uniref:hypothetical protein n=1 Tax=Saccharothrix sp. Mg75 TaxID=3445357 RepID=UPI003EEC2979
MTKNPRSRPAHRFQYRTDPRAWLAHALDVLIQPSGGRHRAPSRSVLLCRALRACITRLASSVLPGRPYPLRPPAHRLAIAWRGGVHVRAG